MVAYFSYFSCQIIMSTFQIFMLTSQLLFMTTYPIIMSTCQKNHHVNDPNCHLPVNINSGKST